MAGMAVKGVGVAIAAMAFVLVAYVCLGRAKYVQSWVLRWRDLKEPSWELAFLRSPAYLWTVRFVGLIASASVLILLWVLYQILNG
jgi:hypothetical protein